VPPPAAMVNGAHEAAAIVAAEGDVGPQARRAARRPVGSAARAANPTMT